MSDLWAAHKIPAHYPIITVKTTVFKHHIFCHLSEVYSSADPTAAVYTRIVVDNQISRTGPDASV